MKLVVESTIKFLGNSCPTCNPLIFLYNAFGMIEERRTERLDIPRPIRIGLMGPIGAGKTTLSNIIAPRWGCVPVEEEFGENPYLKLFYDDQEEFSFHSQFWFLTRKIEQLENLGRLSTPRLADFIDPANDMDRIYAKVHHRMGWMTDAEWDLYQNTYDVLVGKCGLVINCYLVVNTEPEIIFDRIRRRGRPFELKMLKEKPEYFINLGREVDNFVENFPEKNRLLVIDSGKDGSLEIGRIEQYLAPFLNCST